MVNSSLKLNKIKHRKHYLLILVDVSRAIVWIFTGENVWIQLH